MLVPVTAEFVPAAQFDGDEAELAKEHWAGIGVKPFYGKPKPWARFMAESILGYSPATVLEFGCNVGRNLATIRDSAPDVRVIGLDINSDAVGAARGQGLDARVGDETALAGFSDDEIDVSFTISVLDHIPDPRHTLAELCRVSRRAVLLLEPWMGEEGKVVRNVRAETGETVDTTPYSYSWDYSTLVPEVVPGWHLHAEPHPLGPTNLGPYYWFYALTPST
jgi:ubiquinone/menaquinone biosynthesis C-methylase UbiE